MSNENKAPTGKAALEAKLPKRAATKWLKWLDEQGGLDAEDLGYMRYDDIARYICRALNSTKWICASVDCGAPEGFCVYASATPGLDEPPRCDGCDEPMVPARRKLFYDPKTLKRDARF